MWRITARGLLALAALVSAGGCGFGDEPATVEGPVPLADDDAVDRDATDTAAGVGDDGQAATEAGWTRRDVGDQPVLVAGDDADPLTVELTDLEPRREHDVLVGYVLPPTPEAQEGWGVRAGVAGGELVTVDHTDRRHQPDPDNPWIVEARVGRARPGADGTLTADVEALDGAETGLASVRALPASVLQEMPPRAERELAGDGGLGVPSTGAEGFPTSDDYLQLLQRWPAYAEDSVTIPDGTDGDLAYFGDGTADEQGMRTLGNFIYAYALLATDERYDPEVSGVGSAHLEKRARQALRFMARTHTTGDLVATDGEAWGDHWQSSWWTSRMAGGASLLWDRLDPAEQAMVEQVVTFEANRQVQRDPPSGLAGDSKAEENAWDTEALAWAVALFPDHAAADTWRRALDRWSMNALSTPGDARDDREVAGRPVRAWNETTNVHADFTIENHGANHPDYLVLPLQSLTWGVYALASRGEPVPETLLHNYGGVWDRLASSYLGDGRFLYPGGKDWPLYGYGMSLVVPITVLQQHLDDDRLARTVEADRVRTLEWEQRLWGDGGFFSGRVTGRSPAGWDAEFESDAAAALGMAAHLGDVLGAGAAVPGADGGSRPAPLTDEELGTALAGGAAGPDGEYVVARGDGFTTAFSWRTLDCCFGAVSEHHDVLGIVLPDESHMATWTEGQLAGSFALAGDDDPPLGVRWHDGEELPGGGYATLGVRWIGGSAANPAVDQQLAMVSLPDAERALVLDQPVARRPVDLTSATALDLQVPNDVFTGLSRRIVSGDQHRLVMAGAADDESALPAPWANVDDALGVAVDGSDGDLQLRTRTERNLPWGSLRSETLRWRPEGGAGPHGPGEVVRRLAFAFHPGDADETRELSGQMGRLDAGAADVAAAWVQGADDEVVLVAANFADEPRDVVLDTTGVPGVGDEVELALPARAVEVRRGPRTAAAGAGTP